MTDHLPFHSVPTLTWWQMTRQRVCELEIALLRRLRHQTLGEEVEGALVVEMPFLGKYKPKPNRCQ